MLHLYETTEVFEFCDDEDFIALVNRPDIHDTDLDAVYEMNHQLCQDLLRAWYNPERLLALTEIKHIQAYLNAHN
ncbi:hypothetical protein GN244_ATG16817 [Phytophthora infestans]|uniref:Uncharacterized protein n=1 Tax=Phytophthora infestans TaxID=4787 RepID=A0A833RRE9_PHYIN|nr:hypothetical protein GN244_ATG16817 [Phytophthora infestans]KAF4141791.1 hypothetical protein GN958_ATG09036 [Phytophthora infestans]